MYEEMRPNIKAESIHKEINTHLLEANIDPTTKCTK